MADATRPNAEGAREKGRILSRLFIAGRPGSARERACEAALLAGARVMAAVDFDELVERAAMIVDVDMLFVELAGFDVEGLDNALDRLVAARGEPDSALTNAVLILSFDSRQIDPVTARFDGADAQLLCDATLADRVAAIGLAASAIDGLHLSDATSEDQQERLRRLDEEVARIANALARLTGDDPITGGNGRVRDAGLAYGAQPMTAGDGSHAVRIVRGAIRARRMRAQFFEDTLFADPAWDMLLDLYAARLERQRVSVSSLCIAAAVPPTTALRWITTMSGAGLLEREADPIDKRRAFIALTHPAAEAMGAYLAAVERAGLGIA